MARGASRGRSGADARVRSGLERRDAGRARVSRGCRLLCTPLSRRSRDRAARRAPPTPARSASEPDALPTPRASVESRDESSARERRVAKCDARVSSPVAPPRTARGSVSGWHLGTKGAIEPLSVAPLADLDPTGVQVSTPTDWSRLFAHRTKPVRKTVGDASDPSDEPLWVC